VRPVLNVGGYCCWWLYPLADCLPGLRGGNPYHDNLFETPRRGRRSLPCWVSLETPGQRNLIHRSVRFFAGIAGVGSIQSRKCRFPLRPVLTVSTRLVVAVALYSMSCTASSKLAKGVFFTRFCVDP